MTLCRCKYISNKVTVQSANSYFVHHVRNVNVLYELVGPEDLQVTFSLDQRTTEHRARLSFVLSYFSVSDALNGPNSTSGEVEGAYDDEERGDGLPGHVWVMIS